MIRQILKQMKLYYEKNGFYPRRIHITRKNYKRLF